MATEKDTTPERTSRTRTLTDTWLKGKQPLTASEWADEPSPGLRLRVSAKGRRTWFYRYKLNGKTQKITIGTYPGTSLQEARDQWRELSNLRRKNINPILHREAEAKEQRKAEIEAAKQDDYTLASLVDDYVDHISKSKKSWKATSSILKRSLILYTVNRADELNRGNVLDILDALRDAGKATMANRTLAAVRGMYNWAIKGQWPKRQAFITVNPAWQIEASEEASRERALNKTELRKVLKALPSSGLPEDVQDVLMLTLMTGCRINEACTMQWKHVLGGEWRIPADMTKNRKQHSVFLSRQAAALLDKHKGGTHVFSSKTTHHGYIRSDSVEAMLRRALGVNNKILKENRVDSLGVEPFTPHDLRRTMASWLGAEFVDDRIIDRMLNHKPKKLNKTYNTSKYDKPAEKWWQAWADHLQGLTVVNVVSLKKRGADHE